MHCSFAPKHWEDDGREAVSASCCVARSSQVDHALPWPFSAARGAKGVDFSSFFSGVHSSEPTSSKEPSEWAFLHATCIFSLSTERYAFGWLALDRVWVEVSLQ